MYNSFSSSKNTSTTYGYPVHPGLKDISMTTAHAPIFGVGDMEKKNGSVCKFDKKNDTSGGHMLYCSKIRR